MASVKIIGKINFSLTLTDVDKASAASKLFSKFGNINIAVLIDLCHSQKSRVETSTVVKIKLRVLIDNAARINCRAKVQTTRNNS